jgi:hypothetical protein
VTANYEQEMMDSAVWPFGNVLGAKLIQGKDVACVELHDIMLPVLAYITTALTGLTMTGSNADVNYAATGLNIIVHFLRLTQFYYGIKVY